jgi:peptide/nickel transport system permease protein
MSNVPAAMTDGTTLPDQPGPLRRFLRMLWADKFALVAAIFLLLVVVMALIGPTWLGELAQKQNLRGRNAPPFDWERGVLWWLGADSLGRPLLAPDASCSATSCRSSCPR